MIACTTQGRDIRRMALAGIAATVAATFALPAPAKPKAPDPGKEDPTTMTMWGVVRDFRKHHQPGGHPDFGKNPAAGDTHSMGNVADTLDADGRPVFTGAGRVVASQWTDSAGRAIHPSLYDASKGDVAGVWGAADDGAIQSANSFRQWFRDVPGMNTSGVMGIDFEYDDSISAWVYDEDKLPSNKAVIGGGGNSNYEYSYALDAKLIYHAGDGDYIEISGMDDCWVFIDGKLVADLGGVNNLQEQVIHLDRLGLADAQSYDLKIFLTERIKQRERMRIVIGAEFYNGDLPSTMGMYD